MKALNPIKFIYRTDTEERVIRSYLERDLTDEEKWQRHFNHERMRMYARLHPEYPIRKVEPFLPPATQYGDPWPKGEIPIKLKFLRRQRLLPAHHYLLEFGSTVHGSDLTHSDVDYLYIGDDNGYPVDFVRANLKQRPMQHHGPLMVVPEMINYWPMDLIPPFMLHGAFDHGEHEKLALWGTWYHREAIEEFIRSVMFWRSWNECDQAPDPKDQASICLFWSMVTMLPCVYLSAMESPRPKAIASHLVAVMTPSAWIAFSAAYRRREMGYPTDFDRWDHYRDVWASHLKPMADAMLSELMVSGGLE